MKSKFEATEITDLVILFEPFQFEMNLGMLLDKTWILGFVVARFTIMPFLHCLDLLLLTMNHEEGIAGLNNLSMISLKVSVKGVLLLEPS